MTQSIQTTPFDVDQLREYLRKMSDDELKKFGRAAARMVSPRANSGQAPREVFVLQLTEARAEWRRRHFKNNP